jgi:hypothetical protein
VKQEDEYKQKIDDLLDVIKHRENELFFLKEK